MSKHTQSCKDCQKNIYALLNKCFGKVELQYDLNLPARLDDYRDEPRFDALKLIYERLQNHRGYQSFVKVGKLPKVDYYLPTQRIIVEFDEPQHFTRPRLIALESYPSGLTIGFSREKWMDLSRTLNRHDNDPPYRDEQRAWYDTLRDFSAVFSATRDAPGLTVRLYAGDQRWCLLDADKDEVRDSFAAQIRVVEGAYPRE